ncbi:response regulator [Pseudooceanicola sp. HF7]|uniref:response regulator n=1 Tax=Pseudooceanicola sp. HF7 TaxID=2721560 RepID=UPI00143195BD|nr:response regulator [Pseudooceanicola sp. HF7]
MDVPIHDRVDCRQLMRHGLAVANLPPATAVGSVQELLDLPQIVAPPWARVDLKLPGKSGFEAAMVLRRLSPRMRIVLMTGTDEPGNRSRAQAAGADRYLLKPIREAELLATLARA